MGGLISRFPSSLKKTNRKKLHKKKKRGRKE
jgi:hypothetical protein